MTIAYNVLNNEEDAKECVNDTYLNVWGCIPTERPVRFLAYIGKITRNLSLKKWKSIHAGKRGGGQVDLALSELQGAIPSTNSLDKQVEDKELADIIDTFLRELNGEERIIFMRRYWYFDSVTDICKRFGYGESKVKMKLFRTRKKLLQRLEREGVSL